MSDRTSQRLLIGIVLAYVLMGLLYSVVTPPFEASDELWHYPMVKYLADHGLQLPPQDPTVMTAWRQEGSQPPLYYMFAALLTSWIDTSDLDYWRRINPHADIGVMPPDGNINMMVHRPDEAQERLTGALLALQLSRTFSVLLGAGTIIITYHLARALFPGPKTLALAAAAFNAFLPMFVFISGSVNNDNLSTLLGGLLTLLVVRLLQNQQLPRLRDYVWLGLASGAGILSKMNLGFFIPVIALSLLIVSIRHRNWRPLVIGGLVSGALTIAIAGWWYWRNWQLYGDPTGLNIFLDIVGRRAIPANAAQLWAERDSFLWAFWGFFGGVNVALPVWVYTTFNGLAAIGVAGGILSVIRALTTRAANKPQFTLAHAVTLLWIGVTFSSYLRWTAETPASQGRLMFGALSAISVWLAVGWAAWLPNRLQLLSAVPIAFAALVTISSPFAVIAPAYTPPQLVTAASSASPIASFSATGESGTLQILDVTVEEASVRPGQFVNINLTAAVIAPFERDWSLFIHLVTQDNVIIGQRDVYPGSGLLALSDINSGQSWHNRVAVGVPVNAYTPQTVRVLLGWYHLPTGDRLRLDRTQDELLNLGEVTLEPLSDSLGVPNPIRVNYADQIELVGYSLSDLSPNVGSSIDLTLYWRALRPLTTDYVVFAQIIDPATTTIYAASDAMPAAWTRPTSGWQVGDIIEDRHTLTVNPQTPPAIYEIYVGLYTQSPDGTFNRPRVFTPDGGAAFDYAQLTRVRVLPAEDT